MLLVFRSNVLPLIDTGIIAMRVTPACERLELLGQAGLPCAVSYTVGALNISLKQWSK